MFDVKFYVTSILYVGVRLLIHMSQQDPVINETDVTSSRCYCLAQMALSYDLSTFGIPFRTTWYVKLE